MRRIKLLTSLILIMMMVITTVFSYGYAGDVSGSEAGAGSTATASSADVEAIPSSDNASVSEENTGIDQAAPTSSADTTKLGPSTDSAATVSTTEIGTGSRPFTDFEAASAQSVAGEDPVASSTDTVFASSNEPADWALSEVTLALDAGIDAGNMYYQANITRLEFAQLIYRMICVKEEGDGTYTAPESYAKPFIDTNDEAVAALYSLGIVNGMSSTVFGAKENLTREQGAAILVRVSKYFGFDNPNGKPATFYDGGLISTWARQDIKYLSGHRTPDGRSIMGGYNNKFNPLGTYTVQEAILSVYRLYTSLFMEASTDTSWKTMTGCLYSQVILSAAGDCTLGRDIAADYSSSLDAEYDKSGGNSAIFFQNVSEFFNDDITIVNFEGTLTESAGAASKTFRFKGRPAYTGILKSGSIDVVNIANNHSHDYLDRGFYDTVNILSAAGIGYCGYNYTYIKEVNGIKYGFYGFAPMGQGLSDSLKNSISSAISSLKSQGAQYIVGSFHWGVEKSYTPTSNQKSIAHYAVDCGTNLVLGHHPHVLQNVERYKDTEIIYSLGNFCFGGNRNPADKDTVVFQEKIVYDVETGKIISKERTYTPYRLSSVTTRNDYRPSPVYGAEADRVKKKLWVA